jgi:hypothetical protein
VVTWRPALRNVDWAGENHAKLCAGCNSHHLLQPPFYCRDRALLFDKIRRAPLAYPKYLSEEASAVLRGVSLLVQFLHGSL